MSIDIVGCPQPACDAPAEVTPLGMAPNPAGFGIVIHQKILCVLGHVTFTEKAGTDGQEEEPPSTGC